MTGRVYFEPWGLGDALVAAAVLREDPSAPTLACKPRWHAILRAALGGQARLLPVEVAYTTAQRRGAFDFGELKPVTGVSEVLSIRGDPRDWRAARRLFPGARVRMTGWGQFAPHYAGILDLPFACGLLPVRNRYRAWEKLAGVTLPKRPAAARAGKIVIHCGAYRRSKQFPHVAQLRRLLTGDVALICGPNDLLPAGVGESDVKRVADEALVAALGDASLVVTNDSGPMHLAALLGCRTLAICRVTNIAEWLPPGVEYVASPKMPRGYRIDPAYNSDEVLDGWPSAEEVAQRIRS